MKAIIEINEPMDGDITNAVFSLSISDMPVLNSKELANLPKQIKQAYLNFFKMKNKCDMPANLKDFIHNTLQGNG